MKITYGDIPSADSCRKLSMVSFGSPSKNLRVYKFCEALQHCQDFLENERRKLLNKYGIEESPGHYKVEVIPYNEAMKELSELEIEEYIPDHGLTENDFCDEKCEYPRDKSLWMNAADINAILSFTDKMKKDGG